MLARHSIFESEGLLTFILFEAFTQFGLWLKLAANRLPFSNNSFGDFLKPAENQNNFDVFRTA